MLHTYRICSILVEQPVHSNWKFYFWNIYKLRNTKKKSKFPFNSEIIYLRINCMQKWRSPRNCRKSLATVQWCYQLSHTRILPIFCPECILNGARKWNIRKYLCMFTSFLFNRHTNKSRVGVYRRWKCTLEALVEHILHLFRLYWINVNKYRLFSPHYYVFERKIIGCSLIMSRM